MTQFVSAQDATTRPEVCVGAVCVHLGRLLLVRRGNPPGKGQWSIPGGRVQVGELLVQAVVREVHEETGLEVVVDRFLGWVERIELPDHHFVIHDFSVTPLSIRGLRAGDDADEVRWVSLDEVTDLDLVDGLTEFLAEHGVLTLLA